jgi:hypothetical protein
MKKTSKRNSVRFQIEAQAELWRSGRHRSSALRTRTRNISKRGLYLYGDFDEPMGSEFVFEVRLPAAVGSPTGSLGGVLKGQGKLVRREIKNRRRIGFAAEIFKFRFVPDKSSATSFPSPQPSPAL